MEKLKRERTQLRRLFTQALNEVRVKLTEVPIVENELTQKFKIFEDKSERLFKMDENIKEFWLESDEFEEGKFEQDCDTAEEYRNSWIAVKLEYGNLVTIQEPQGNFSEFKSVKRHFRLPELVLKRFDGNVKNWLGFWGQFKKINDDQGMDDEDKFQYLIQATTPESTARELVESFPPSGTNYKKAIEQLKSRFARDELLIEIYVRELLSLVLSQAVNGKAMSLSSLHDKLETQLRALETLGVTTEKYAAMLYPLVESALPEDLLRIWERSRNNKEEAVPENQYLTRLLEFLKHEVEGEERLQLARSAFAPESCSNGEVKKYKENGKLPTASCLYSGGIKNFEKLCLWCDKKSHLTTECFKANSFSLEEKKKLLKSKGGCYSCLKTGHFAKRCKSFVKCLICNKKHQTMMCPDLPGLSKNKKSVEKEEVLKKSETLLSHNVTTLLQTILVRIIHNGKSETVRALLDSGSQKSYLKRDVAERLHMTHSSQEKLIHSLFGGIETKQESHKVYDVMVQSLDAKFQLKISVLDKIKLCGHVPRIGTQKVKVLNTVLTHNHITLTDVGKNAPEIGLLIGADYLGQLLTGSFVIVSEYLVAIKTKLGWTLQGIDDDIHETLATYVSNLDLTDLWTLETIGIKEPGEIKANEDLKNEAFKFFQQTVKFNEEKRYEVNLPWREGHVELGHNKELAEKRLRSTTKRLIKLGHLEEYDQIFDEWQQLNIIELVTEKENVNVCHYLPHHAVIKDSSLTTKIRPVFDASTKDQKGNFLNACLTKGPNLVELIPKLLLRFRKYAIGVTSDIKKAFLQISLSPSDRDFLRFLWWKDENREEVITFRHRRLVFGLSPSPFLLGATISHHLDKSPDEFKETAEELKQSFYLDNCVTSLESIEEVDKFISESKKLMSSAQFELRGWVTTAATTDTDIEKTIVPILGLSWDVHSDELFCCVNVASFSGSFVTKRMLLSVAQRIFDPIGFTAPTTLIPKLILQRSWMMKCGWDDELPEELSSDFHSWLKNIQLLNDCRIPRRLTIGPFKDCKFSLHIFCDASKMAYAACVFLRISYGEEISVRLVQCKSRIAPVKIMTIPRLELLGALIATRLYCQCKEILNLPDCKTYFWSDSAVALSWIKGEGNWNVFIENRVREIRNYTLRDDWHHIPGSMNPADLASRGCDARSLLRSRWWEGPNWLKLEQSMWPFSELVVPEKEVNSEKRKSVISNVTCNNFEFTSDLKYFSYYTKIVRMIAWILRFVYNSRPHFNALRGELVYEEFSRAEEKLLYIIQMEHFEGNGAKMLKEIQTFKDSEGIIRVKTKLALSEEKEDFKCPILLPSKDEIVHRMVYQKHCQLQHAGLGTLLTNLRERYWIIGIRRLAKKICSSCVICKRFKTRAVEPPFAPLPLDRIKYAAVFEVTGIDLAGPLYLLSGRKCWIVLFTCAIYRAVHMELVKSLSTDCFIMALRRFIARRGRVTTIYTDNGTNFVGTSNGLRGLDWNAIQSFSTVQRIKWNFNPPSAPWWGGWWERMIRMVKELLRRILGRTTVDYEELETILNDCEATINSRPLTYVHDESENLRPLTPANFLQGIPHSDVPDLDTIDSNSYNKRLRYLQKLRVDLRTRFRNEYLAMLVHRGHRRDETLKVGDVVLINTDCKRTNWPLGLVLEIFQGSDGHGRVARVKTALGERIRPLQRLYPLEVDRIAENEPFKNVLKEKNNTLIKKNPKKREVVFKEDKLGKEAEDVSTITRFGRKIRVPKRMDL